MRTIAIVNQKGGCGKTTVSINLASALAEHGQRTLLVDMDPQGHCAVGLAVPEEQVEQSVYDVLISNSRNEPIKISEVLWQISGKLELAPASLDLSAFEQQMYEVADRECALLNVLENVKGTYDYVIIDCPPAVGLLTFNALRAATDVIVPVETGYFALHGLSKQLETLSILCEQSGHQVNVKVLASMYDIRTKMAREVMAELRNHFADKMFKTIINFNTKIKEAASFGQPICEYDPASKGHKDFSVLSEEILNSEVIQQSHEVVNSLSDQLDRISITADELLETSQPTSSIVKDTLEVQPEEPDPILLKADAKLSDEVQQEDLDQSLLKTDAKLSEYYGVNRINDAVMFVALYPRAKSIQLAGDFNSWQPEKSQMEKVGQSGVWQAKMALSPGKYRYRLVVDGQWQQDPYNEHVETNPFGGFNSVVEIK